MSCETKGHKNNLEKSLHHSTVPKWKGNPKSENKRGPKGGIGFSAAKWVGFLHQSHGYRRQSAVSCIMMIGIFWFREQN